MLSRPGNWCWHALKNGFRHERLLHHNYYDVRFVRSSMSIVSLLIDSAMKIVGAAPHIDSHEETSRVKSVRYNELINHARCVIENFHFSSGTHYIHATTSATMIVVTHTPFPRFSDVTRLNRFP